MCRGPLFPSYQANMLPEPADASGMSLLMMPLFPSHQTIPLCASLSPVGTIRPLLAIDRPTNFVHQA